MAYSLDQTNFRGRNDDGSESSATWIAAVNTDWTQDVDANFRVRFSWKSGADSGTPHPQLQYNLNSGGWNDVNATSSVVRSSASPNESDGALTTQQISSGTFFWNVFDEVDGFGSAVFNFSNESMEAEYCVQIRSGDVADEDTIDLRVVGQGSVGTVFDTYTNIPTITVNEAGGDVSVNATTVALTMATQAATVNAETEVDVGTVALTMATHAATVTLTNDVTVDVGTVALTMATHVADVDAETSIDVGTVALTMATHAADVDAGAEIDAGVVALTMATHAATITLPADADVSISAGVVSLTMTAHSATITLDAGVPASGGSTLSAKEKSRKRKLEESEALAKALKRQQALKAKEPEIVKSKPKKVKRVKADKPKDIPLTDDDAQWVKEVIDKPWVMPGGSAEIDNELRMRDQSARDMATRQMEEAILARQRFLQDEDEAIAQILIMMM